MTFDRHYPNRKDHRAPYRRSARFDRSCRPHGGCAWCEGGRLHSSQRRMLLLDPDEPERELRPCTAHDVYGCPLCDLEPEFKS